MVSHGKREIKKGIGKVVSANPALVKSFAEKEIGNKNDMCINMYHKAKIKNLFRPDSFY